MPRHSSQNCSASLPDAGRFNCHSDSTPKNKPTGLAAISSHEKAKLPLTSDLAWYDDLVGLRVGSVGLLAGSPGARKSGLATQLVLDLAIQGVRTLTILTEEGPERLLGRVTTMAAPRTLDAALRNIEVESGITELTQLPNLVLRHIVSPHGRFAGVRLVVLDSVQGSGIPAHATEQYGAMYDAVRLLTSAGISVLLLAHVTKRGEIAGPKTLEHSVDVTLRLERVADYRLLALHKNRFGPENPKGIPLEIDPHTTAMRPSPHTSPVVGKTCTFVGRSVGLTEMQAAVSLPPPGMPPRTVAPALPRKRVEQIVGCLGRMQLGLGELNLHLNALVPGYDTPFRGWMAAALAVSIIGSCLRRQVPSDLVVCGEVDLARDLRPLPTAVADQLAEAMLDGSLESKQRLIVPNASVADLPVVSSLTVVPCDSLDDVVRIAWPDLIGGSR